jgi:uncharacterized integral membrane protein
MNARLIFSLVVAVIAIVFALQNPQEVRLRIGPAAAETTVAVAIIIAFILGVLSGGLGSVLSRFDRRGTRTKKVADEPDETPRPLPPPYDPDLS